jgi:hypothetical protein
MLFGYSISAVQVTFGLPVIASSNPPGFSAPNTLSFQLLLVPFSIMRPVLSPVLCAASIVSSIFGAPTARAHTHQSTTLAVRQGG